jgi:cytochrome c peroxidase
MRRQFAGNKLRGCASIALWMWLVGALTTADAIAADNKVEYVWRLPPGFPKPVVPPDNPMSTDKVQLGCRLFFDTSLSINGTYACASCHRPELAFSDGRATAVGATGERMRRNAMSLTNVAYNAVYTWASMRIVSLEAQMATPLFGAHPIEMGLQKDNGALRKSLATKEYGPAFDAAFPGDDAKLSMENVVKAIAAYERTLISGRSAFDRYVFDDVPDALSPAARRGMTLFYSKRGGCAECHSGLNFSGVLAAAQGRVLATFANTGLYDLDGHGGYPVSDLGLLEETNAPSDMGRFRVPTLRNIALTAPYMHDGSIANLKEVVEHYVRGGRNTSPMTDANTVNSTRDARVKPLSLTNEERDDLVAFLGSLTDTEFATADQRQCSRIGAP